MSLFNVEMYVVFLKDNKNYHYDIMKFSDWTNEKEAFRLNNPIYKKFPNLFLAYNYVINIT